jgi:hypothetical protein
MIFKRCLQVLIIVIMVGGYQRCAEAALLN